MSAQSALTTAIYPLCVVQNKHNNDSAGVETTVGTFQVKGEFAQFASFCFRGEIKT